MIPSTVPLKLAKKLILGQKAADQYAAELHEITEFKKDISDCTYEALPQAELDANIYRANSPGEFLIAITNVRWTGANPELLSGLIFLSRFNSANFNAEFAAGLAMYACTSTGIKSIGFPNIADDCQARARKLIDLYL